MFIPEINGLTFRDMASYPADLYVFDRSTMNPPKPKKTTLTHNVKCRHMGDKGCFGCTLTECHTCQGLRCSTCLTKDSCEDFICLYCVNYPYQCALCDRYNKFKKGE